MSSRRSIYSLIPASPFDVAVAVTVDTSKCGRGGEREGVRASSNDSAWIVSEYIPPTAQVCF
jgi:hypothetical protein